MDFFGINFEFLKILHQNIIYLDYRGSGSTLKLCILVSALPVTDIHVECGGWADLSFDSQILSVYSEPVVPPRDPWQECDLKGSHMQPGGGPEQGTAARVGRRGVASDVWQADLEVARRV